MFWYTDMDLLWIEIFTFCIFYTVASSTILGVKTKCYNCYNYHNSAIHIYIYTYIYIYKAKLKNELTPSQKKTVF